jgi:hypothetical protein
VTTEHEAREGKKQHSRDIRRLLQMIAASVTITMGTVGALGWWIENRIHEAELRAQAREIATSASVAAVVKAAGVQAEKRDRHLLVMVNLGRCAVEQLGPLDCDPLEGIWEDSND